MRIRLVALTLVAVALGGCAWFGESQRAGLDRPPPLPAAEIPADSAPAPRGPLPVDDSVADRIVAVVNNDAITLGELLEAMVLFRHENRGRRTPPDHELQRDLLAQLIDSRLQLQEAEREKITAESAEVAEELAARMKRLGATTPEEAEAMIKAQGLDVELVKRKIRESLRVQKVIRRKVGLRVSVTDQEIDRYLAENRQKLETGLAYHARHILILSEGPSDAAWEAARIRAETIRQQLLDGADFAELARTYSKDASAKDGGDLGTLKRGELAREIEDQILTLRPAEVSTPFRSALGYHIFRLEWKETLEGEGLVRARQQVREILYRQKYETRLDAWLKDIKQRAIIEIRM